MKKAFTLVELLVVVVVIMALLSISFRLMSAGGDSEKRSTTLARMQRIENCLSGYYAAFGSYPPVALHAKRNVYLDLDQDDNQMDSETSSLNSKCVEAACRAQPFAACFPFPPRRQAKVEAQCSLAMQKTTDPAFPDWVAVADKLGSGVRGVHRPSDMPNWQSESKWEKLKLFEFGVMSFLLPRFLFMADKANKDELDQCAQWDANNQLSAHPNTGLVFGDYESQMKDVRLVRRIPSQAVCARWLPNLEGIVSGNDLSGDNERPRDGEFFGIKVLDKEKMISATRSSPKKFLKCFDRKTHTLHNMMTVLDGWGNEFYYYSPQPFQSYRLWSAGANGVTFPPWVPLSTLKTDADRRTAANWMADDIMYLSH